MLFSRQEMLRRMRSFRSARLVFDLAIATLLVWQGWGWLPLLALAADAALLGAAFPRLSQRQPLLAVMASLALLALLVLALTFDRPALAPLFVALLLPLPVIAAAALGLVNALWTAAGLATIGAAAAAALAWRLAPEGAATLIVWLAITLGAIWLQALTLRQFVHEERRQRAPFSPPTHLAAGLAVTTVNDALFEASTETLAALLRQQVNGGSIRWLVLNLDTSAPITSAEIERLTEAARGLANCKVTLARVPADATVQPGAPPSLLKRLDHYVTVAQAVEVGLRHLGWVHPATTLEAREARQPIRIPTSLVSEDWWDAQ